MSTACAGGFPPVGEKEYMRKSMVVTDLDGTLLHRASGMHRRDISTLRDLGKNDTVRVIATGRSLYSARSVLDSDLPIDYLVFSSGAGIVDWPTGEIIRSHTMSARQITETAQCLLKMKMDFMVHRPIPDNHFFTYYGKGRDNPDFLRRIGYYEEFAKPGTCMIEPVQACQIVAVEPETERSRYSNIREALDALTVIRTTSPMDGVSTWIEIFPPDVSKAKASEWIRRSCGIDRTDILAVGNDYNDLDLLGWAFTSFVVDEAPADLQKLYRSVRTHGGGISEAVERWENGRAAGI